MEENQKTSHEEFWQITLPLILGSLAILGLAVWTVIAVISGNDISQQADTSAVLLLVPFMLFSLVPLAIVGLTAYGVIYLKKVLPKYTSQGQKFASLVEEKTKNLADKLVEPVFSMESFWASLQTLFRR